ncbi:MAG: hypothetical protein IH991_00585 [Planctomycetes bacterium]|nr:hypothetical protein [Planctomycetota bacterium]
MHSRKQRRRRLPKLPIRVGKAQQTLSAAIILGDDELASWIDRAMLTRQVTGTSQQIVALSKRLDRVMAPN